MINRMLPSIAVMIALWILMPVQVHAFGLGKIKLLSALNEPFKAEIPVTALRKHAQDNLQVRLATSSEFSRAGLERHFFLTQLAFTVIKKVNSTVIEISSQQSVKEPFMDFLITATIGEGRLLREYTVLLDPPKSMFVKSAKVVKPAKVKKVKSSSPTSNNKTSYQYPDSGDEPSSLANYLPSNNYGPTKRNDTLWVIAKGIKPASVSIHQMMIALLDENPNAFINNNINTLKIGQTLTIPSSDEISRLSHKQAVARAVEQTSQWKNAANTVVATAQKTSDTVPAESGVQQPSTEIEDPSRLQLVADDTAAGNNDLSLLGGDKPIQVRDQLTRELAAIESQGQAIIDFKARMDAMEDRLAIMRKIISVRDADLARLQSLLDEAQQADPTSDQASEKTQNALGKGEMDTAVDKIVVAERMFDGAAVAAAAAAAKDEEEYRSGIVIAEDEVDMSVDEMDVDASMDMESTDEVAVERTNPEDKYAAKTGLLDKIKAFIADNKMNFLYGLGGLLVALLAWLAIRHRKQSDYEWLESDSLQDINASEAELAENVVEENRDSTHIEGVDEAAKIANVQAKDEAMLLDTSSVDATDEIAEESIDDLLSQAEMLIAYGEYEQAHIVVDKASKQGLKNQSVTLKLIALAYHQQQAEEFNKLVSEIDIDKESAAWLEVVEWGKDLVPENPLFADNTAEELSFDLDNSPLGDTELDLNLADSVLDNTEDDALSFDTDFDFEVKPDDADKPSFDATVTLDIDSDTDSDDIMLETNLEDDEELVPKTDLTEQLEERGEETAFDLDELLEDGETEVSADTIIEPDITDDEGFDIGDFDEADEAETKLDLAASYIDMGDPEGARSMLEEVLKEGNADQKSRAEDLLNNLAQ